MFKQSLFLAVLRIRNGLFRTRIQLYISILQYYRIHSLEFTGLKVICSFIFGWIRNNNSGSRSRQKFRIHADPDPDKQHWFLIKCSGRSLPKCLAPAPYKKAWLRESTTPQYGVILYKKKTIISERTYCCHK